MVRASALTDGSDEPRSVSVSSTDGIVAASGKTPGEHFTHVEVAFLLHPAQNARP
jgi:hypothetical protein